MFIFIKTFLKTRFQFTVLPRTTDCSLFISRLPQNVETNLYKKNVNVNLIFS